MTLLATSTVFGSIITTWNAPTGSWTSLRLIRNNNGVPRAEDDGDVLFTDAVRITSVKVASLTEFGFLNPLSITELFGVDFDGVVRSTTRTSYLDEGLTADRYYYYALYTFESGVWTQRASTQALIAKDWGYAAKLYDQVPAVYKDDLPDDVEPEDSFLYKFLSVFGFQLDTIRTEIGSLNRLRDAILVNQSMLPPLAQEVGITYEPEIGIRSLRRFIANAIHLWALKGSIQGVRELASVITGYVVHVRIGRNLALDNLDAGPSTDRGRWHGRTNCTVTYRANTINDVNPAGEGVHIITATGAAVMTSDMNCGDADSLLRRQYAIPVLPGLTYLASRYFRVPVGTGRNGQLLMQWLDADGAPIGAATGTALTAIAVGTDWTRLSSSAAAPANARYLEVSFATSAMAAGQTIEACGFMVQESNAIDDWQCARKVLIFLDAELINYVGNTSGTANESWGWSADVQAVVDPTLGAYLTKFVPDPEDPDIIVLLDALAVDVPGDVVPSPPAPPDSFATTVVTYEADMQAVSAGQTWTVLAEATPPTTDSPGTIRTARVGFLLFNGSTQVGEDYGLEVELVGGAWTQIGPHELTVPAGAAYDRVEVSLSMEGLCGFRHVAMEQAVADEAFYFEGSSASATGDYLWEGQAFRSPTLYYPQRSARTVRLRDMLTDYLPHGACFDLVFDSTPTVTPAAIGGPDADPMTSLPL